MAAPPQVTICIPVYNGAQFVAQVLELVARQTYRNVKVLISDDASTDGSAELCRGFAREHGFELIVQPERRGWVENCNWLLERAPGDFSASYRPRRCARRTISRCWPPTCRQRPYVFRPSPTSWDSAWATLCLR